MSDNLNSHTTEHSLLSEAELLDDGETGSFMSNGGGVLHKAEYVPTSIGLAGTQQAAPVILPAGISRQDAIVYISKNIPVNEYGLPMFFYRSDLLPYDLRDCRQDDIDAAAVTISYAEGFPTLDNGTPWWAQMPHEPFESFLLFQRFVKQAEETGIRQLNMLATDNQEDINKLQALYREFYWSVRAKAYDLFIVAADQKRREHRIRNTEDKHFKQAGQIFDALLQKFDDPTWIEELSAKEALDALEQMVKIQRLSLGLTGQNASSTVGQNAPRGASTEIIMRNLTKEVGLSDQDHNSFNSNLQDLLADPALAMQAQELIIRVNQGQ